jgi:hypothetical protein
MLALRPEFLPIMGSRTAVNAQNDSERAQDDGIAAFFRAQAFDFRTSARTRRGRE